MKPIILDVSQESPSVGKTKIDTTISFSKYINYIKGKAENENSVRKEYFEMVIKKLEENPDFLKEIPLSEVGNFKNQLDLVYGMLIPPLSDEKSLLWALSVPVGPVIFYGTDSFYDLMTDRDSGQIKCNMIKLNSDSLREKIQKVYTYILEELYDFPPFHYNDQILTLKDECSGLQKFYRLNVDNSFTTVCPKGELPELDLDSIRRELQENSDVSILTELLPLSLFQFKGFSIITLTDVTAEHAVEHMKNTIINRSTMDVHAFHNQINESLKMMVENPAVEFGLMPLLKVNNRLIFNKNTIQTSKLINAANTSDAAEEIYIAMAEEYFKAPKVLFMRTISKEDVKHDFIRMLKNDGVESYAVLPVYYDKKIVGVLEVYSTRQNAIDEGVLSKLQPALSLAARIMHNSIEEFNASLENVIREKFTSLQPAVQWKFKDVAWHYLRDNAKKQHATIESIGFKDVYPLYGAVDIRNSTIERNAALREDLQLQFTVLIETFSILKQKLGFGLADEMVYKCKKMIARILDESTDNDEMKIHDFLETEVHPFLIHFKENRVTTQSAVLVGAGGDEIYEADEIAEAIDKYFEITDEQTGVAYANRRALENSMQTINSSVNLYLDLFKSEIQKSYPTYFEKFRTDGIEYDIYIGQSLEPERAFSNLYLKNIRLWQLTSMAAIAKITNSLLPNMEKKLLTTQLIFINSGTIDISFRDDERRFDVEGAYNIRYQVIKKRIDKVHVKGTGERLTQPGKIALVYFNRKSADEYVDYIRYLQEQNTLLNDLEFLDLEELQGVNGLKALRIGVNLESDWK
ncbi:GAF domain-containing protein [Dyadobacter sp. NIV53]|uniref:GAF domain-containing protein n=1 Tax=Dyadobacter sp. NIV53 TaxID=2861765 RepID=UPI001C86E63A|nr:GAF domain-containing protein [Dyadobacter sp. NIV53]